MNARFQGPVVSPSKIIGTQGDFPCGNTYKSYEGNEANDFVTLQIRASALQRLIGEHRIVAEELRCLNCQSRDLVRNAMLEILCEG